MSIFNTVMKRLAFGTVVAFNSGGTDGATDGDIRDTSSHSFTFPDEVSFATDRLVGIKNGLISSVNITVNIVIAIEGGSAATLATYTVAEGGTLYLHADAVGPSGNSTQMAACRSVWGGSAYMVIIANTTPTSGTADANIGWRT